MKAPPARPGGNQRLALIVLFPTTATIWVLLLLAEALSPALLAAGLTLLIPITLLAALLIILVPAHDIPLFQQPGKR